MIPEAYRRNMICSTDRMRSIFSDATLPWKWLLSTPIPTPSKNAIDNTTPQTIFPLRCDLLISEQDS